MKVPHAEQALVERKKIREYLLNRDHPDNGGKAEFFAQLGFTADDWITLAAALRFLAKQSEVSKSVESKHGSKYIVDGVIENPRHRRARVRTVWIADTGETIPRLVTVYLGWNDHD